MKLVLFPVLFVALLALTVPCMAKDSVYVRYVTVTYRDFTTCHPDFLFAPPLPSSGIEKGIVEQFLGSDGKPVYALGDNFADSTTSGEANFNQWFNDDESVNLRVTFRNGLTLFGLDNRSPRVYRFNATGFFPIDNQLFGNGVGFNFRDPAYPNVSPVPFERNYLFTAEIRTSFTYRQGIGELEFLGDDDIFLFLNGELVLDLGGRHSILNQENIDADKTINVDEIAAAKGWQEGDEIAYDLFYAERQTAQIDGIAATLIFDLPASEEACYQRTQTVQLFENHNGLNGPDGVCESPFPFPF